MTDKTLTEEDLNLLEDEDSGSGETSDDTSSTDASKDAVADKTGDAAADDAGDVAASGKQGKSKDTSILDGLDDDEDDADDDASKDDKDGDPEPDKKDDKPDDEKDPVLDWRETVIARALKGQENTLTAAKLEKRREALRRDLSRYKSAEDYMLAGMAARERLRSGEYRRAKLPDDASEEEVAAWRKENGIPETADSYEIPKVNGHRWKEDDTPFIDSFKSVAHGANFNQEQMNAAAKWYADTMAEQQNEFIEKITNIDREDRQNTRDQLLVEMGKGDLKPSLKLMDQLLQDDEVMPDGLGEILAQARYQDENGQYRRVINTPSMARFLIAYAKETYGEASMPMGDAKVSASNRKKEIEDLMTTDITEYYRRGWDKELLEINQKEENSPRRRRG